MTLDLQMPTPTCAQGVNSKSFKPPPMLSPYLSVAEIADWHFSNSHQHPFYVYYDKDSNSSKITTITWGTAVKAIYRIANLVSKNLSSSPKDTTTKPLVGIYCTSESLTYMLTMIGIMRAGFPVFLISTKASPASLEHLIVQSGVTHILVNSHDRSLSTRLSGVRKNLTNDITVSNIPHWSELYGEGEVDIPAPVQPNLEDLCFIVHSSGSTALPELNKWTHRMTYNIMWHPWYGDTDICGEVMSACAIPMGGPSGLMQALFAASSGLIISGFSPAYPQLSPTLDGAWESMIATHSTYGFIPNSFLAVWAENDTKIHELAKLHGVIFGGAPLAKDIGDKLAANGVNVMTFYGSSEAGMICKGYTNPNNRMDWEWFTFHPLVYPAFRNTSEDGVGELVLKTGPTHRTTRTNIILDGLPAYATGDLLEAHPTIPTLWRYVSRVSDQETIGAAGPKINVVAMARMLMRDPLISGAVLFSHTVGITTIFGVIIDPAPDDFSSPNALETFKSNIWPTIESYNTITHDPARILKSNIIIASPHKPFVYGDKEMPRRKDIINAYRSEIESLVT